MGAIKRGRKGTDGTAAQLRLGEVLEECRGYCVVIQRWYDKRECDWTNTRRGGGARQWIGEYRVLCIGNWGNVDMRSGELSKVTKGSCHHRYLTGVDAVTRMIPTRSAVRTYIIT